MKYLRFIFACIMAAFLTTSCISAKNAKTPTQTSAEAITDHSAESFLSGSLDNESGRENESDDIGNAKNSAESDEEGEINSIHKSDTSLDDALDLCELSQEYWQKGELENALEALDQAYDLILKVDDYDNPVLLQQKDDLRFMISKRILEIYASRNIVVNGNYNEIPLTINSHVQKEIDLFTTGAEKKFFIAAYKRSGQYRPMIVKALQEAGLPQELSWLPLIESGYKVNALSRARALGLWQFIPSTGYKFGLKRDRYIDERLDFEKSTMAAIDYMKELHQIFGEWSTVLAAYNCGEGRVLRVIRSQNVNYLDNFWDLYERLPRETARYVPRFLATLHIVENPQKYGLDSVEMDEPLEYEVVEVSKKAHIKGIAEVLGIPESQLKDLNPELRYNILPSENYALRVPPEKESVLVANLDEIPSYTPPPAAPHTKYRYHRVRRGETISTIARRYRSSIKAIARANRLNKRYTIRSGQTLKIPTKYYSESSASESSPRRRVSSGKTVVHTVRAGDSLWVLARKYGTTTKTIRRLNGLSNSNLYIGQKLKISSSDSEAASSGTRKYKVRSGDSPFSIAKKHNMSLERFLKLNRLSSHSKIFPGQTYYVE